MNHSKCGSKIVCFASEREENQEYCKRCLFHIPDVLYIPREEGWRKLKIMDTLPMIRDKLKEKYPHGHPKFLDLVLDEIRLHSDKNFDYAGGGKPTGNFERVGQILHLYPNLKEHFDKPYFNAIVQLLKQLDAALWLLHSGLKAKVEGQGPRWRDISVFSKLIPILIEENK